MKRKRKFSSDSLDSLEDAEDEEIHNNNTSSNKLPSGINVQVIAKHDKKLIKLNVLNTTHPHTNRPLVYKPIVQTSVSALNDIDDLPSESDVSTGMVLIPLNNNNTSNNSSGLLVAPNSVSNTIKSLKTSTNISICYKCMKCNRIFNEEGLFKMHHESNCDTTSSSSVHQTTCSQPIARHVVVSDIENEELERLLFSSEHSNTSSDTNGGVGFGSVKNHIHHTQVQLSHRPRAAVVKPSNKQHRVYICNECGIQFHLQSDLNRHMLQVHENAKPFECGGCPMRFYELTSKNRHEKEHSGGLKPFRCYICSLEFTRASNLRTHIYKVHSNEIGKLVHMTKTEDNKLKFEFDLGLFILFLMLHFKKAKLMCLLKKIDAINVYKEQHRLNKFSTKSESSSSSSSPLQASSSNTSNANSNNNNAIIYIKDPNNKNADIQHVILF